MIFLTMITTYLSSVIVLIAPFSKLVGLKALKRAQTSAMNVL